MSTTVWPSETTIASLSGIGPLLPNPFSQQGCLSSYTLTSPLEITLHPVDAGEEMMGRSRNELTVLSGKQALIT